MSLPGITPLAMRLANIQNGHEPEDADHLIRTFHAELQKGDLFAHGVGDRERVFLQYIEHAFGRYIDGKPLEAAFGFILGRGEKNANLGLDDRDLAIAASVELIVREDLRKAGKSKPRCELRRFKTGKRRLRSKVKMESTYDTVAKRFDLSSKSIERVFRENEAAVESFSDSVLSLLADSLTK